MQNYLCVNLCFWLTSDAFQFENAERLKQIAPPPLDWALWWPAAWRSLSKVRCEVLDLSVSLSTCGWVNGIVLDSVQVSRPTSIMWICVCWQGRQGCAFLTSLSVVTTACKKNWPPVGFAGAWCSGLLSVVPALLSTKVHLRQQPGNRNSVPCNDKP